MKPQGAFKLFYYQKYLGLFLIMVGLPMIFFAPPVNAEFPLMIGLYTLFTSMEKVEDERSLNIKMSSLYIAFIFAYAIKILVSTLFTRQLIPFNLVEINHFVILVLSLAVAIYYSRLHLVKS
jgi:hypothetical protein